MTAQTDFARIWATLLPHRGDVVALRRVFETTRIPMVLVDSSHRYLDANASSRLLLRSPRADLRLLRSDDLIPQEQNPRHARRWDGLLAQGFATGSVELTARDGSVIAIDYSTVTNMLPGAHLCVWMPSGWPLDELGGLIDAAPVRTGRLTPRERQVLTIMALGSTMKEAATELSLSENTIRTHVGNAMRRLGARHRAHAIAIALNDGEITMDGGSHRPHAALPSSPFASPAAKRTDGE